MRAAQVLRLEGPAGVEIVTVDEPEAAPDTVLVDVHAAGVSFPDLLLSSGRYQLKPELPFTLGVDFAGVVRCAPDTSEHSPGDRVAGWGPIGAAAEVVSARPENVLPLPAVMSFGEGACLPMNYLTAHYALLTRGCLKPGETVLIHGASGGVGTAAIQVAKAFGGRVLAVVSTPAKGEVARALGADDVLPVEDFSKRVLEITQGIGVDVVLDVVGSNDIVLESLRAMAVCGRLLVVGFAGGEIATVALNRLLLRNVDLRGVAWGPYTRRDPDFARRQWEELLPHMESGAIKPRISTLYPFDDVGRALVDLAERRTVGKSVLAIR
jgi:NADPH2:quinone reductase